MALIFFFHSDNTSTAIQNNITSHRNTSPQEFVKGDLGYSALGFPNKSIIMSNREACKLICGFILLYVTMANLNISLLRASHWPKKFRRFYKVK